MTFTVGLDILVVLSQIKLRKHFYNKLETSDDFLKIRLIAVDYAFESETVLYDNIENKGKTPSTRLAGNFSFDTLHHDLHGGMLARFRLTSCKTRNCGNVPDLYVSFVQGGNNIQEVLYDPTWNFLYAIINAIYTPAENGKGDKQVVDTVYGRCQTYFSRPEDRRFRRQIRDCEIKGDLQNTKVDADIIVIDAVELLTFRTPFDNKWGFALESKIHVEITNRTMDYVERHCSSEKQTCAACAREKFGAVTVGEKLYEKVLLAIETYNKLLLLHLYEMGDTHTCEKHSELFSNIVQESRYANEQDWKAVIMEPNNDPVHVLGNVLGALGNSLSLKVAREVLFVEDPNFIDDYLFGAAHSTSYDEKWHKQLMYWLGDMKNNEVLYWKIANTVATVLRRRCEQSSSTRNSCRHGKVKVMNFCIAFILSLERARGFLCSNHSSSLQMAALQLIKAASSSLYDSRLSKVLIKIFRNVCPQPTSTGESQLAVDILVKSVPDQQHVGTILLRSETTNPDDHEKWQYFYRAVRSSRQQDELKEEFWRKLRNFKVFRPNYAHRALVANSGSEWREIAEHAGYKLYSVASTEFRGDVFKRSEFDLRMKHKKQDESIFGVCGNVMVREFAVSLPLLSGLTVQANSAGAVSLKMLTSSSVSLWNQDLSAGFKTKYGFFSIFTLKAHSKRESILDPLALQRSIGSLQIPHGKDTRKKILGKYNTKALRDKSLDTRIFYYSVAL
ncbi:unnamed protein product [Angiostrongylus costaricensis]|uniref:Apolipophorin n=1 Tax=Angiostrongylus costaricensis TaxID=334426 RepID=A0A158PLY7_ANGCS|nr:unnamed protein product [Angiostrongylus costaricensis]